MDELEPTQGAGPCIEDLFPLLAEDAEELFSTLVNKEYNVVDVLIFKGENVEAYVRCFVSLQCLEVKELRISMCGSNVTLEPFEWPETDKAIIREGCLTIAAAPRPRLRVSKLLNRLRIPEPKEILGYRPVEEEEPDEL